MHQSSLFFEEIFEINFLDFNLDFVILKSKELLKNQYLELRFVMNIILTQGQVWIINIYFLYLCLQTNQQKTLSENT